jgi:hypothetical protein
MKDEPAVKIRIDGNGWTYCPGETLSGEYFFENLPFSEGKTLEVSIAWITEGKGEEDMAVHEFWRTDLEEERSVDLSQPRHFTTTLPYSPLSYDGRIVKIRWCVRVRAFFHGGKEVFGQKFFRLGEVPPVPNFPASPLPESAE